MDKFKFNGDIVIRQIKEDAEYRLMEAIDKGLDWLRADMDAIKNGREYRIMGETHRASAEDETPAILFGDLVNALGYDYNDGVFSVGVNAGKGLGEGYAKWLELGVEKNNLAGRFYITKLREKIREFL